MAQVVGNTDATIAKSLKVSFVHHNVLDIVGSVTSPFDNAKLQHFVCFCKGFPLKDVNERENFYNLLSLNGLRMITQNSGEIEDVAYFEMLNDFHKVSAILSVKAIGVAEKAHSVKRIVNVVAQFIRL